MIPRYKFESVLVKRIKFPSTSKIQGFFICESWLLYEDNWRFMKSGCNILQFQSLFDIVMSSTDDRQAIERIFGKRRLIKKNYPENTSLQKSAKKFMLDGGKLGEGLGVINKNEI